MLPISMLQWIFILCQKVNQCVTNGMIRSPSTVCCVGVWCVLCSVYPFQCACVCLTLLCVRHDDEIMIRDVHNVCVSLQRTNRTNEVREEANNVDARV